MAQEATEKKSRKGLYAVIAVVVVVALIAVFAIVYSQMSPSAVEGEKTVIIEVIDDQEITTSYTVNTDAEYLRQAMEEADGLTFDGTESEYGMYVETVNGVTADYDADGAYWSFYVNGDYCNYGIESQPITDGDTFSIVYTVYIWTEE